MFNYLSSHNIFIYTHGGTRKTHSSSFYGYYKSSITPAGTTILDVMNTHRVVDNFYHFYTPQGKKTSRYFYSTSGYNHYRHTFSNMIYLPSPLDNTCQHKLTHFINSLDPQYHYLFFFYTYLTTFMEDFKSRGPTYFYTGIFIHDHFLLPNSSSHSSLNCFSELARSFSRKINYFEEFEDLSFGEDKSIERDQIIMLKVFNIGDINDIEHLNNRFGYETPGDLDEFSLDFEEKKFYTADYSKPISLPKKMQKLTLNPNKALIFLADGIRNIG